MRPSLLLCLALLVPASVRASVVLPLDLDSMVDQAEQVVHAQVESQASRWTSDHSAIYTDVTLRVLTPLKGEAAARQVITVRREGGVVGNIGMRIAGAARFSDGEEVVLFLERRGAALWTLGLSQGKLSVGVVDGQKVALSNTAGLHFAGSGAPSEPAQRPLRQLFDRITARVTTGAAAPAGVGR
jgi:hypothetical protein